MEVEVQIDENRSKCCCSCSHQSCASLFHEPANDFVKSQYQKGDFSKIFLIYRWCFAIWFTVTMSLSLEMFFFDGKWFIYFTNWGYILCTLTAIYSALLVSIYCCTSPKAPCPYWWLKLYWALHISTFVCATGLSFIYWVFIHPFTNYQLPEGIHRTEIIRLYRYFFEGPDNHSCLAFFHNINSHAINSIMMILDQIIVAFPTRIMHFIYPAVIVTTYVFFTIVYYLLGGENVIGKPYIYQIVDWGDQPYTSTFVCLGGIVLVFPMCVLGYLIYKIRLCFSSSRSP